MLQHVACVSTLARNDGVAHVALLASFLVKLSHTLDHFCLSAMVSLVLLIDSRASVTSLFCKARERKALIRESLSIKANDVDGLNQLEPVLDSHPYARGY